MKVPFAVPGAETFSPSDVSERVATLNATVPSGPGKPGLDCGGPHPRWELPAPNRPHPPLRVMCSIPRRGIDSCCSASLVCRAEMLTERLPHRPLTSALRVMSARLRTATQMGKANPTGSVAIGMTNIANAVT
jgi:hypothetical protein